MSLTLPRKLSIDAYCATSFPSTQPSRPELSRSHSSMRPSRRTGSRCTVICTAALMDHLSHHAIAAGLGLTMCRPQNVCMLKALCSRHYQRKPGRC